MTDTSNAPIVIVTAPPPAYDSNIPNSINAAAGFSMPPGAVISPNMKYISTTNKVPNTNTAEARRCPTEAFRTVEVLDILTPSGWFSTEHF
jgi:hypothetical protein